MDRAPTAVQGRYDRLHGDEDYSGPTRAIDVDITSAEELKAALCGIDHDGLIECIANILAEHDQAETELSNIMDKHSQIPSVIAMTRRVHELKVRVIAEVNEA
jgi:hypothetical protein